MQWIALIWPKRNSLAGIILKGLIFNGINFRGYKFSRVLIFAGINSRNFVKIRENSRKLIPAKYAKMADSRKFAKINPREKFKLLVRENWFHENAK